MKDADMKNAHTLLRSATEHKFKLWQTERTITLARTKKGWTEEDPLITNYGLPYPRAITAERAASLIQFALKNGMTVRSYNR
jgi:hypothetical protein